MEGRTWVFVEVVEVRIFKTLSKAKQLSAHSRSRISEAEKTLDSISLQLITLHIIFVDEMKKTSYNILHAYFYATFSVVSTGSTPKKGLMGKPGFRLPFGGPGWGLMQIPPVSLGDNNIITCSRLVSQANHSFRRGTTSGHFGTIHHQD